MNVEGTAPSPSTSFREPKKKKELKIIAEINIKIEYLGSTQYTPTQPKRWTIVVMFGGRLDRGKFWSQLLRLFHFG